MQKRALLRRASALLYSPDREHFGIVPVEAMYCRCPVIAVSGGWRWGLEVGAGGGGWRWGLEVGAGGGGWEGWESVGGVVGVGDVEVGFGSGGGRHQGGVGGEGVGDVLVGWGIGRCSVGGG